jgi:protein SDA1
MESVLAGREDREKFGSSIGRKKKKTGGLTEREKQKRKAMPIAARVSQLKKRTETTRKLKACKKNFKGHT